MTTLIFLLTFLTLLTLAIRIIIKTFRHQPARPMMKIAALVLAFYGIVWTIFFLLRQDEIVPLGTDVCFDDWCATVVKFEQVPSLGGIDNHVATRGKFVILHLRMSNHARGIAQKPSEPRVHIVDENGNEWSYDPAAQLALERNAGAQPGIEHRLELHESLETQLIFNVPEEAHPLKARIDEGPLITLFLFPEGRTLFSLE